MRVDIQDRTCSFCGYNKIIEHTFKVDPIQKSCGSCAIVLFALGDVNKTVLVVDTYSYCG